MPDEMVIRHCAPTLASIRTGSLFSCPCESEKEVLHGVQELNRRLGGKGLRVLHRRRIAMVVQRPKPQARSSLRLWLSQRCPASAARGLQRAGSLMQMKAVG